MIKHLKKFYLIGKLKDKPRLSAVTFLSLKMSVQDQHFLAILICFYLLLIRYVRTRRCEYLKSYNK